MGLVKRDTCMAGIFIFGEVNFRLSKEEIVWTEEIGNRPLTISNFEGVIRFG